MELALVVGALIINHRACQAVDMRMYLEVFNEHFTSVELGVDLLLITFSVTVEIITRIIRMKVPQPALQ